MTDTLHPSTGLLCKLASVAVHADEYLSPGGHELDVTALRSVLNDPQVKEWVSEMAALALAPRKRT